MTPELASLSAADFGRRMARALLQARSSSAFFFIQQALLDMDDYISWEDAEAVCNRLAEELNV